jgi:hypothetical protein
MGWAGKRLRHGLGGIAAIASLAGAATAPAARAEPSAPPGPPAGKRAGAGDPTARLALVELDVRAADALLRDARFEEALARVDPIRAALDAMQDGAGVRRLRVRTEVLAATALVALDREDAARDCFRRALAAEPALDLDPATTAPKVLRVFLAVRSEPRSPR